MAKWAILLDWVRQQKDDIHSVLSVKFVIKS